MIEWEIVLGPPGTGKTTQLLNMVDEELGRGVPPDRIGYVSFTRRAATEAVGRATEKFGLSRGALRYFRTLHSLCFQALGLSAGDVLEGQKLQEFGDWAGVRVTGRTQYMAEEGTTFGFEVGDRILYMENLARVRCLPLRQQYDAEHDDLSWPIVDRVCRALGEFKKARNLVDFTDMLTLLAESDWRAGLEVLFVDEAQDLSLLQWAVVRKLAQGCRRVVVAGDDDQAIYRWAGAAVEHFVGLPGRVTVLGQSWRVPEQIQGLALDVISRVSARRPKQWAPRAAQGSLVFVDSLDELDLGAGDDVLVLGRNACFLKDDAAPLLRSGGIVYEWRGAPSVRQSVVDAVLAWERLRRGEAVSVTEAAGVYEHMAAGVGYARGHKKLPAWVDRDAAVTLPDLRDRGGLLVDTLWSSALTRLPVEDRQYMTRALRRGEKLTRRPTVKLSTIHGSKGGQAEHVVLIRDMAHRTYVEAERLPEDEARVWYVAATRARSRLTVVAPRTRRSYLL